MKQNKKTIPETALFIVIIRANKRTEYLANFKKMKAMYNAFGEGTGHD